MGIALYQAVVSVGPIRDAGLCSHGPVFFASHAEGQLVTLIEIMIDAGVVLVPVGVLSVSNRGVLALHAADPPIAGDVQAVARRGKRGRGHARSRIEAGAAIGEVVRQGHPADDPLDPSGRIESRSVRIAAKDTDRLKISRRALRPDRIAVHIDGRVVRKSVTVLHAGEKSEDPLARLARQHTGRKLLFRHKTLTLVEEKEEGLVPGDRPAQTRAKL